MPMCPIAIPSSTPIVLNSNGTPPASRTASFTIFPNSWRCTCPGIKSIYELQIPIKGFLKSSSLLITPVALSKLLCGALSYPLFIVSDLIAILKKKSKNIILFRVSPGIVYFFEERLIFGIDLKLADKYNIKANNDPEEQNDIGWKCVSVYIASVSQIYLFSFFGK